MTVTFSARRTDQPLQIGSRHGYRIDRDQAAINAELSVPPYHPGGGWALQLWASEQPYQGGELTGVRVAEVQLELPTPLGPYTHKVEAAVPARLPLQGRSYFMSLALVELGAGERRVRDVACYPALETFPGPQLHGEVGYEVRGHEVLLRAAGVGNPRGADNLSGTLSLELWAWPVDGAQAPEAAQGVCMGAAQLQPLAGGGEQSGLQCRAPFNEPLPGSYLLSLLLREWTNAHGYVTRDRRDFALAYHVALPAAPPSAPPAAPPEPALAEEAAQAGPGIVVRAMAAPAVPVQPVAASVAAALEEEPELDWEVPEPVALPPASVVVSRVPAAPVAVPAAPVAVPSAPVAGSRASRTVSLNRASVEELARLKGLSSKLAKEIVKRRPFEAIEQLIEVRGIGKSTLDKLRALVAL